MEFNSGFKWLNNGCVLTSEGCPEDEFLV